MKSEFLLGEELALMQKQTDTPCISVIVPTHKLSPERRVDHLEVERALNTARELLANQYTSNQVRPLLQSLDDLYRQIDFTRNVEGIGLFVSEHTRELVLFHFPVKEKVMISDAFETRDWLYQLFYAKPYFVLLLTEQDVKLFKGRMNTLEEVHEHGFPLQYVETYEYSRPSRGSSYVGNAFTKEFERDKSQLEEIRFGQFLDGVDRELKSYLFNETPLILVGTRKDVAAFKEKCGKEIIAGEIYGNNLYSPLKELADACFDALKFYLNRQKEQMLKDFEEKIGEGLGVYGLLQCWKAAREGRALTLLVEKDYVVQGFISSKNDWDLYLQPPAVAHQVIPDAVNTLIEDVLARGGQIVLLENGALFNYLRVGIITRY